jgi:hypothetical protein
MFTKDAARSVGVGEVVDCGELELESSKGGPKKQFHRPLSPLRETLVLLPKSKKACYPRGRASICSFR